MKKRDRRNANKQAEPVNAQGAADVMTKKIAAMLSEFMKKTGQTVVEIHIDTFPVQPVDGKFAIQQTINLKYGQIVPREPPEQPAVEPVKSFAPCNA